ncbi:hypothetical protein KAU05_01970, partial [Candidatus Aerophobetes bacterium]|nr:hypothetical protein [Candidatus Aerophobetes bacterium]
EVCGERLNVTSTTASILSCPGTKGVRKINAATSAAPITPLKPFLASSSQTTKITSHCQKPHQP